MAQKSYYVVAKGRKPGIYRTWAGPEGAAVQVAGYAGAKFKGFVTLDEAQAWLKVAAAGQPWLAEVLSKPLSSRQAPAGSYPAKPEQHEASQPASSTGPAAQTETPSVQIYTDGGCDGNPGRGGYGAVLLHHGLRIEISGGFRRTTNNRMELYACIIALRVLNGLGLPAGLPVTLFSDSRYVVDAITKGWVQRWQANNWQRSSDEPVRNPDLWLQLMKACQPHPPKFHWLAGHSGYAENERCDQLSTEAMWRKDLPVDEGYEPA